MVPMRPKRGTVSIVSAFSLSSSQASSSRTLEGPRVEPLAASQIDDGLSTQITEQFERREMLYVQAPGLLLGAFVFCCNLVIICRHYNPPLSSVSALALVDLDHVAFEVRYKCNPAVRTLKDIHHKHD